MKLFTILMDDAGTLSAQRSGKSTSDLIEVTTLKAASKIEALRVAKVRIQSGMITLPPSVNQDDDDTFLSALIPDNPFTNKAIFCDFNGVLNDINRYSEDSNPSFSLAKEACPHKIMRLVKLALKHDAKIVMTSLWRRYGIDYSTVISRCLLHCDIAEYRTFFSQNRRDILRLTRVPPTDVFESRDLEIADSIINHLYTHFVVFEDEHPIRKAFNVIMTDPTEGLQDAHIEKADDFLAHESLSSLKRPQVA